MKYDVTAFRKVYAENRRAGRCVRCKTRPAAAGRVLCAYDREKGLVYQRRRFKSRLRPTAEQKTCSACRAKGHNKAGCDLRELQ